MNLKYKVLNDVKMRDNSVQTDDETNYHEMVNDGKRMYMYQTWQATLNKR